ncbi:uncharacterized protein LOC134837156 [Culicoides brevitarsis]|uniref:uncharacterized protein LOC134837156 n=1 Tax=Culicoides brevitarsis TaxID=469753 RepID=UPI00307B1C7F
MSSSSDSDSDENTKMLMASIDTSFLSENFYKESDGKDKNEQTRGEKPELPKSNRYIENNEEVLWKSDINITESMKKYCGQKFSEMVSKMVEFVDVEENVAKKSKKRKNEGGVRLLKGAPIIDLNKDSLPDLPEMLNKPLDVKRRQIEKDSLSETDKIKEATISSDVILSEKTTKHFKNRQKPKVYEYKTKKGVSYLKEPDNEFTALRKKNNWSESKIKETHEKIKKS